MKKSIYRSFLLIRENKYKGAGGAMYVIIVVFLMTIVAAALVGWELPRLDDTKVGKPVTISTNIQGTSKGSLQLYTFQGVTPTPPPQTPTPPPQTPTPPPQEMSGCAKTQFNTEDEILVGSDPAPAGQTSDKLRVWVIDELAPMIAANEIVDRLTGHITQTGDRSETDRDSDGRGKFLWEPALYIKPATGTLPSEPFCDATTANCTPYFPVIIKGDYNSNPVRYDYRSSQKGPDPDSDWINFQNGPGASSVPSGYRYGQPTIWMAEYIWDVTTLGLAKGAYWAQFSIHDGDTNLGISCITIQV